MKQAGDASGAGRGRQAVRTCDQSHCDVTWFCLRPSGPQLQSRLSVGRLFFFPAAWVISHQGSLELANLGRVSRGQGGCLAGVGIWDFPFLKTPPLSWLLGCGRPKHFLQKGSRAVGFISKGASSSPCSGFLRVIVGSQKARSKLVSAI